MESLKGKVILITGATAGIGKSCAYAFAREGANLILTARRKELIDKLAIELSSQYQVNVHNAKLDVRDRDEIQSVLKNLPTEFQEIDVLLNNAGLARGVEKVAEGTYENWDEMIDTNIKGLLNVTRAVLPSMIERNSGHIINLGSTAGHMAYKGASVYCATKYGVRAISDSLRIELVDTAVKVTSVDPGAVETDFSKVRFNGDEERASKVYEGFTPLTPDDVAESIIFCATRPLHANINELIITSTSQANSLVIHRE
jgi:3-hydroxy acid dehydrogenase/malonic semialdehyde reductase